MVRHKRFASLALVALASVTLVAASQVRSTSGADQEARLQIRQVMDGLYVIPGFDGSQSGGNVAVRVTGDGVVIVDDKFPHSFEFILEQVARVTDQPIRYVLNTHHHGDHAGSNPDFMRVAEVVAHENARANIVRNGLAGPPRVVFSEQAALFLGDAEARMYHFGRGHTDGDAAVYFPDLRAVHTGDLFIFGTRMDGSTLSPFWDFANGGSLLEWPATLTRLLALDFDTVIPGHGPVLTRADVRDFRRKLELVIERMQNEIRSGATREEIASRIDTSDLDWPLAAVRIREAYDELTASR
jgi:glyoxylase-like metal-dependent hydrolase (beta-lactamase superfamily II)